MFWHGACLGVELGAADAAAERAGIAAARSLSTDVDPAVGMLPPGDEDASSYDWPRPGACIDGLPGTVPLLTFAADRTQDSAMRLIAEGHARGLAALCIRPDGSVSQTATYDHSGQLQSQTAINGSSPQSTWARAQAWAMLGYCQAAHRSAEFLEPAIRVTDWYLDHVAADQVCFWDFDDPAIPDAPRDTSATAIAAAALIRLAPLSEDRHRKAAADTVDALARRHMNQHGALVGGCYNQIKGVATSNELIWGDYFLLESRPRPGRHTQHNPPVEAARSRCHTAITPEGDRNASCHLRPNPQAWRDR